MVLLVATLCKSDKVERLYQAEGFPKNISIEELTFPTAVELNLLHKARSSLQVKRQSRADFPTFDKWYRKTHNKVYPITITSRPDEDEAIQTEAEKISEESQVHDPVRHPFKYPSDKVANINKKISISIKFPDGMKIVKTGISFTELKHLIERLEVV